MHMTHCPHCGEKLEPEVKRPDGCICDNNEWDDPYTLPPVCDKFEADHVGMNCTRCEHDYECHAEARSNKSLIVPTDWMPLPQHPDTGETTYPLVVDLQDT